MFDLRDRSLLTVVEEVLGPWLGQDEKETDFISRGTHALYSWYRMVYVLANASRHPSAPALWGSMSIWHRVSFRMLFDWWTASYQDPAYSLVSILALVDRCSAVDLSEFEEHGHEGRAEMLILQLLELKRWPEGDIMQPPRLPDSRAILSGYHDHAEALFMFEFDTSHEPEGQQRKMWWGRRRWARSRAARSAFCQQMACQLLEKHEAAEPKTQMQDQGQEFSGVLRPSTNSVPTEAIDCDFERVFGAEKHKQTDLMVRGAVIEACPWLPPVSEEGLPYYLWDVKNAKTVESSTLQCHPKYAAISHTWGRWATGRAVHVKGVTGWKVPQNTRFPVEEIPEILRRAPFNTPYVWLDLCCIPQDPGSAIGAREIARQAQIFRNAQIVVAWLNDVDEFQVLGDYLRWKALQLLRFRPGLKQKTRDALVAETWQRAAGKRTGLLEARSGSHAFQNMALNAWFTSLWTLQEVAMRPDMWMSAKDWSLLSVDGVNATALSGFIAILEIFFNQRGPEYESHLFRHDEQTRVGLDEMEIWRFESGLCKLLNLDQVSILTLGDRRQCTGRRAESIMSALGTTQWYERVLQKVPPGDENQLRDRLEKDLVLGKYPISFVQEVCRKVHWDFFGSYLKMNSLGNKFGYDVSKSHGSMLPFSISSEIFQSASGFRTESSWIFAEIHSTVRTWQVKTSGQVHIREACIVSSSMGDLGQCSKHPCRIIAATTMPPMSIEEHEALLPDTFRFLHAGKGIDYENPSWFDLNLWISRQPTRTHAILTEFCPGNEEGSDDYALECSGIIIQESPSGTLMKTSHFHCFDEESVLDLLEVKRVDWLVA